MEPIEKRNGAWFYLSVKRIWDTCCSCLCSFGIMADQLPCECPTTGCGYQYCSKCVQSIKQCNSNKESLFRCMYCHHSSLEGPRHNRFLIDLLWKSFYKKYGTELLSTFEIPGALSNDIACRLIHLQVLVESLKKKKPNITSIPGPIKSVLDRALLLINTLKEHKEACDALLSANSTDHDFDSCLQHYVNQLSGEESDSRKCGKFIELCETLLYYIAQARFENYFPKLNELMVDWEKGLLTNATFQPKVTQLFKAFENDLNQFILPTLPPRVGIVGSICVGKTSVLNRLRQTQNEFPNDLGATSNIKHASPIRVGKSTLCQLEFEHEYPNKSQVIFVDIQGATDDDSDPSAGNYFDEIRKANCDLYIIVFDSRFTKTHQTWKNYVETELHRQCWFVRNKADYLFLPKFEEDVGQNFNACGERIRAKYASKIIDGIRETVRFVDHENKLPHVYLTFACEKKDAANSFLSETAYGKFDLEKLLHDIQHLPLNLHKISLLNMGMNAVAKVVNTCFRRGYVVNVSKYKIYAGVAAVIPLADLIVRYYGREEIRQAFGVNSHSRLYNWWYNQTDEFKDYLQQFNIEMDPHSLKTSVFKKTFKFRDNSAAPNMNALVGTVGKGLATTGIVAINLSDDALRLAGVGAVTAVRGLSLSFIVGGLVASAGLCAWAAVSNGKQMYNHLNRLCDDIIYLSAHAAVKTMENNDVTRRSFSTEN